MKWFYNLRIRIKLINSISQVNLSAEELNNLAGQLREMVDRFKV